MQGHRRFLSMAVALLTCAILMGCSGKVPQNGPGPLNIAQFTLQGGAVNVTYRQLLVASGGLQPYTWCIVEGDGQICDDGSLGALPPGLTTDINGVISGTPGTDPRNSFPHTYNFTVKVTDAQSPTKAVDMAAKSITINPDLTFTANPLPSGTVGLNYSNTSIQASNGVAPYLYTVATCDTCGSLPDGLTLMTVPPMNGMPNSAIVIGTPTTAGVFTFTVQATDSVNETATATFTITVVGRLQGPYALTFNGFDTSQPTGSQAFYLVGSLTAANDMNGSGTISGVIDQNGPGATISTAVQVTGTYSIGMTSNFGTISFTRADNNATYQFTIVVSSTADSKLILVDPNSPAQKWGSGLLKKQTATNISISSSSANYVFGLFGNDAAGQRYAGAGVFALTNSLAVLGGEEDVNDNGTASSMQPIAISGSSFGTPDPTTGRGTATLMVGGSPFNYIYYVATATELVAIENDPSGPMTVVDILQQGSAGITGGAPALCKPGDTCQGVLELNAISSGGAPEAQVGVVSFAPPDQMGHNIIRSDGLPAYYTDQSTGGTLTSNSYPIGTGSIDATCGPLATPCGRVTVTLQGATYNPVWYLTSETQAFVVGTDPDVTQGTLQPQTGTPFTVASLLGSYLGGTTTPVSSSITNQVDVVVTPPPGGVWSITFDTSGPTGNLNGVQLMQPYVLDPTYGAAFGKFEVTNSTQPPQAFEILYLAGGTVGATGNKAGVVGVNVGVLNSDGTVTPDPNPRLSNYGR